VNAPLFTLIRLAVRAEGAFGVLIRHADPSDVIGVPFAVTLERTYDKAADAGVSQAYGDALGALQFVKIVEGRHRCVRRFFERGGYWTYDIQTPEHTATLLHKGVLEQHSEGCVLVGESYSILAAAPGIADSGPGLAEFLSYAGSRAEFDMDVVSVGGPLRLSFGKEA
jgi:hypothetical protein